VTTGGSLVLNGTATYSGDILSAGGDDGLFGIYNTRNSGDIRLIAKNSTGSDNASLIANHGGVQVNGTLIANGMATITSAGLTINGTNNDADGDIWSTGGSDKIFVLHNISNGGVTRFALKNTDGSLINQTLVLNYAGATINGALNVTGDIAAFFTPSDRNWKDNIAPLTDSLSKVCAISGNRFDWNKKSDYSGTDVGLIAQEVRDILPEAVAEREDGHLSVSYIKIIPLLVEAIKELRNEVENLKKSE
jgi:hypothetical protein